MIGESELLQLVLLPGLQNSSSVAAHVVDASLILKALIVVGAYDSEPSNRHKCSWLMRKFCEDSGKCFLVGSKVVGDGTESTLGSWKALLGEFQGQNNGSSRC